MARLHNTADPAKIFGHTLIWNRTGTVPSQKERLRIVRNTRQKYARSSLLNTGIIFLSCCPLGKPLYLHTVDDKPEFYRRLMISQLYRRLMFSQLYRRLMFSLSYYH